MSIAGLGRGSVGGGPRAVISWAVEVGARAVTLDGALPGLRARELGRSARRDLAALLGRAELGFAGIDLWIPTEHFGAGEHADRAVAAVGEALELASELAGLAGGDAVVSVSLPEDGAARPALLAAAERTGAAIADVRWPAAADAIGVGLDPATLIAAGADPIEASSGVADRLVSARLSDLGPAGRIEPGAEGGRLDLGAYAAVLGSLTELDRVIVDLRGLRGVDHAARRVLERWSSAQAAF